jgi:hypothetical protein
MYLRVVHNVGRSVSHGPMATRCALQRGAAASPVRLSHARPAVLALPQVTHGSSAVVQLYIDRPLTLDKCKIDLRL